MAGDDCVCPLNELRDPNGICDAKVKSCLEDTVVGRYVGLLKIVDRVV